MRLLIEKIPDLQVLYVKQLRLLLSAEEMIAPKSLFLLEAAVDDELQSAFNKHWKDSEQQAARLREMINRASSESEPIKCKTIYSLFDEAEELVKDSTHKIVRDIALAAVALRIKHYELSFYEAVRRFAEALGRDSDADFLDKSLREEMDTAQQFARIADRLSAAAQRAA